MSDDEKFTITLDKEAMGRVIATIGVAAIHEEDSEALKGISCAFYDLAFALTGGNPFNIMDHPLGDTLATVAATCLAKNGALGNLDELGEDIVKDAAKAVEQFTNTGEESLLNSMESLGDYRGVRGE